MLGGSQSPWGTTLLGGQLPTHSRVPPWLLGKAPGQELAHQPSPPPPPRSPPVSLSINAVEALTSWAVSRDTFSVCTFGRRKQEVTMVSGAGVEVLLFWACRCMLGGGKQRQAAQPAWPE